ncbi:MAG TPA: ClpXP protease specificity-enhancing factor SspB [Stellaceae bacterium]|nr:ClpXP protease specificity-enhancing factor SspB [Stellaceae bacterium]
MAQDLFQYEKMVEAALRGVVRDALKRAAREGLRAAHHFYIGFDTRMPGVVLADHLRGQYPGEMTIVLQHQFWDLKVGEESFSVTLSFHKQLERLVIPFAAVRGFADPSVNFALEFAMPEEDKSKSAGVPAPIAPAPPPPPADKTTGEVVTLDSFRKR